jgi:hypothetical protein
MHILLHSRVWKMYVQRSIRIECQQFRIRYESSDLQHITSKAPPRMQLFWIVKAATKKMHKIRMQNIHYGWRVILQFLRPGGGGKHPWIFLTRRLEWRKSAISKLPPLPLIWSKTRILGIAFVMTFAIRKIGLTPFHHFSLLWQNLYYARVVVV